MKLLMEIKENIMQEKVIRANETVEEANRRKMKRNQMDKDCRRNEDEQQSLVSAQMFCAGQLVNY